MWQKLGFIKYILIIGILVGGYFAFMKWGTGLVPGLKTTESQVIEKTTIQKIAVNRNINAIPLVVPSTIPWDDPTVPEWVMVVAAWNAQMGLVYANGGAVTTEGSLMHKAGVRLRIIRQDDYAQQQKMLSGFVKRYKQGDASCGGDECAQFSAYMGDGATSYMRALNELIKSEVGPEYTCKGFGSTGYSRGEDKYMDRPEILSNPQLARGSLVIVVLRDGDFNIVLKFASDNNIPVNPDETTYDPDAINFVAASSFTDAAQKFVAGWTETRRVVKNGKRTDEKRTISATGVSTWLPGDQIVIDSCRGPQCGVVTIASTKEYAGQMPNFIVGSVPFLNANRAKVDAMLKAIFDGGEMVKAYPEALQRGGEYSAQIYAEADANYWATYFNGVKRTVNINGRSYTVELGGSSVNNLGDNLLLFGLLPGSRNIFKDTYEYFGKAYVKLYPQYMPDYPPYEDIMDTTFLCDLRNQYGTGTQKATLPQQQFTGREVVRDTLSKQTYAIEFESGSANLTPDARATLERVMSLQSMTMFSTVIIEGHTDTVGNDVNNQRLSESRAYAVRDFMYQSAPLNFPYNKFQIRGYGETQPIDNTNTATGLKKNRRVVIVVGR